MNLNTKDPLTRSDAVTAKGINDIIVSTVTDRIGSAPFIPIKRSIIINTKINLDGDANGYSVGTCKHTLSDEGPLRICRYTKWKLHD